MIIFPPVMLGLFMMKGVGISGVCKQHSIICKVALCTYAPSSELRNHISSSGRNLLGALGAVPDHGRPGVQSIVASVTHYRLSLRGYSSACRLLMLTRFLFLD